MPCSASRELNQGLNIHFVSNGRYVSKMRYAGSGMCGSPEHEGALYRLCWLIVSLSKTNNAGPTLQESELAGSLRRGEGSERVYRFNWRNAADGFRKEQQQQDLYRPGSLKAYTQPETHPETHDRFGCGLSRGAGSGSTKTALTVRCGSRGFSTILEAPGCVMLQPPFAIVPRGQRLFTRPSGRVSRLLQSRAWQSAGES